MLKHVLRCASVPLFCLVLASCLPSGVKTVDAVNEPEFRIFLKALQPMLTANHILSEDGSWYSPRMPMRAAGKGAGRILLDRLSPAFRFPDMAASQLPLTFRDMFTPEARIRVEEYSFSVLQGGDRIDGALLALTDWDGNGEEDWLALCRVSPTALPGVSRDYYLLIADPEAPVLVPRVLGIRDCRNQICQVFDAAGNSPLFQDIHVLELTPGESPVTAPPEGGVPVDSGSFREEKLAR